MRAMLMTAFGPADVLKPGDAPVPTPGEHDLLVEVHASAMNPIDYKVRREPYGPPRKTPCILGYDVSGVVRAVGAKVERFKVGDEVYASPNIARDGSNAEFVCVDARTAAIKPAGLSHTDAAALPLVVLTAWGALHRKCQVHRGETALIHAGAGGVGHIAVQLAKLAGCRVITTAGRAESIEFCRKLGADVVIDHGKENFVERVQKETGNRGCEVVFDTVGGEVFDRSLECVAINGRIATIVFNKSDKIVPLLFRKSATLHCEFMGAPTVYNHHPETQGQILQTVSEYVEAGKLRAHVSKVLPLEQLVEAHRMQESGRTIGKIVVKVR